jgi:hypothetical protein
MMGRWGATTDNVSTNHLTGGLTPLPVFGGNAVEQAAHVVVEDFLRHRHVL